MTISCLGSGLSLLVLACYSFANTKFEMSSNLSWIPIISLSSTILLNAVGISSLTYMMITELVPQKVGTFWVLFRILSLIVLALDS